MATVVRVTGILFGIFFLLISIPMMVGGVAVLGVPAVLAEDDGFMYSPSIHLNSQNTHAFVTESFQIDTNTKHYQNTYQDGYVNVNFDNFGKIVNFRIKSNSYFIGLGPSVEVENYLSNVSYTVVDNMNNGYFSSYDLNVNSNESLTTSPSEQSFWLASGVNEISYTPSIADFNKDLTLVVMKEDGSQGVNADVKLGVNIPILTPIGIGLLVIGGLLFALTILLFVMAYRSKDQPKTTKYFYPQSYRQYAGVVEENQEKQQTSQSTSKYCVNCGNESDLDSKFCESCGFKFKN